MTARYLIGLDAGGGSGRCLLVNTETGNTTSIYRTWSMPPAPEEGNFAYKLDTANICRILGEIVQEAIRKAGITPQDVAGIAATSMRHSTIVIDKKGKVLLAAPNRDARAAEQGMQLAADRTEELYQITGHAPSPIFTAARLLWLKETHPDTFKSAYAALSFSDWIGYMLTSEAASELSQAGESLLLDLKSRKWSADILRTLGLSEKILPPLKHAGAKLGKLTKEAASNLGLLPGIPVAVGGPDTQCGLLGAGVISAGQTGVITGTTTPIQMVVNEPIIDGEMRLWTVCIGK
jgi:sugar (pentulose or hexulose) kinase